jgi:hypothetical protein
MAFSCRWLVATTIFKDERLFVRPLSLLHPKKPALHANTECKVRLSSHPIVASGDSTIWLRPQAALRLFMGYLVAKLYDDLVRFVTIRQVDLMNFVTIETPK